MMLSEPRVRPQTRSSRSRRAASALAALVATLPVFDLQCGDEARRQFKNEAFPEIQTGVQTIIGGDSEAGLQQILNGIVNGIFYTEPVDTRFGTDGGAR